MTRRLCLVMLALGALALAFPPAAAGGGCSAPPRARVGVDDDGKIAIEECAFADTVTYVEPGESVTWTSKDVFPHTVTGAGYAWGDEKILELGDRVTYSFGDEGVYPYFCALHPSMVGVVVVGDAPATNGRTGGVEKVDLAAAASDDALPPGGGDGSGALVGATIVAALAGLALAARLALRRRAGTTPA